MLDLTLTDSDRFSIPDPWDTPAEAFVETTTPAIVNSTPVAEASLLAAAPEPKATPILLQNELKLYNMEPSFWMKIQEILAQLYWADSICDT
jgi:hypothetical protein